MIKQEKIFIFGFGYTASYFTKALLKNNFKVTATTRNHIDKSTIVKQHNLECSDFNLINYDNHLAINSELNTSQYVLISTPPCQQGCDPVMQEYIDTVVDNKHQIKWLSYLSTTGVYGDYHGEWVDENSPCLATTQRALSRIKIEEQYLDLYRNHRLPTHIFRLAGIYGPNKSAIDKFQKKQTFSIYKPNQYFSRIHVEDIAGALFCSLQQPTPGEIYNLCDNLPAQSHEVDAHAAKLLKQDSPDLIPIEQAELSELALEFYSQSRKVSNDKIKSKLGYNFKYPDFKAGLHEIYNQTI